MILVMLRYVYYRIFAIMLCYTFSLYYVFSLHVSSYVDELSRTHETGTTVHSLCEDFSPHIIGIPLYCIWVYYKAEPNNRIDCRYSQCSGTTSAVVKNLLQMLNKAKPWWRLPF